MVDVLAGYGIKMRFDFWRLQHGQCNFVLIHFLATRDNLMFNPAQIKASILDNELGVKGFKQKELSRWDLDTFRALSSIQSWVPINKDEGFLIFMDYQGLNKETIKMNLSNALMLDGRVLDVPIVHFRANPLYKH
ncbi:MAG: hypothetical protein CSYNP_00001 [Syntrophus sp. SKADARSKE-3]|nr:hypothetical protein [Syntrophus sp. SKADARSKE-3]